MFFHIVKSMFSLHTNIVNIFVSIYFLCSYLRLSLVVEPAHHAAAIHHGTHRT